MDFFQDYTKNSLSDMVVKYVKNMILSGQFKSGDKLVESDISEELDVSRAPVREALRQLTVEGMVKSIPRKGCFVEDWTLDEILEIFDIRIVLEKQIIGLLVQRKLLKEKDFINLRKNVEEMRSYNNTNLQENEIVFSLNSLDLQFHSYLWQASKSNQRSIILNRLFHQLLLVMNQNIISLGTFSEKADEHMRIVDALYKNNLNVAIEEFDSHISKHINSLSYICNKEKISG